MHWLGYFVAESERAKKQVHLILLLSGDETELDVGRICAAGFFTEYSILGQPTRIFSTDDAVGFRTVIAPASSRGLATAMMVKMLWHGGARAVLATVDSSLEGQARMLLSTCSGGLWGERERLVERFLDLCSSYEATLATLGKSTRFNLRYYRKRLQRSLDLVYEENAGGLLSQTQLDDLNKRSLNPVSSEAFRLRCRSGREFAGSFLVGLRTSTGEWLSLVGGWRQGTQTVLYWQLNVRGREKDSIGTVMRSYFLEHEVARGATSLLIYGGTPHSMRHAFRTDRILDIVLRRQSSKTIGALLWCSTASNKRLAVKSHIAEVLSSAPTTWHPRNEITREQL